MMFPFGSFIIFTFFSVLTHQPISVHGTSETQDSNTTSASSSTPSPKSIPIPNVKYPFSVQLTGQSSSDIETRWGNRAIELRYNGYSKCTDGRVCSRTCDDPKVSLDEGQLWYSNDDLRALSDYCISGRCGLNINSTPICGEGKSSNCESGKLCTPDCFSPEIPRKFNKDRYDTPEKYDSWKKEQQEVIDDQKLGKFCKSGVCVIDDYIYVCGIGLRQASISIPVILLIPSFLIAKTLI